MDIYQKISLFYCYTQAEKQIIGKSLFGRNIYAIKIGNGSPVGIAQYAIHGREYITAELALEHFRRGVDTGSFWLVPLANPDGALLSQKGLESVNSKRWQKRLLALNHASEDFSLWKANGRGVDLNVNFDARWGTGKKNVKTAGAENCIGEQAFSEPETKALKKFTEKISPDYTVSYHTKGEEIYWYFYQSSHTYHRDKRLGMALSSATGYPLAQAKGSAGGYKDWCVETLKIPSFTIEAGADVFRHPLGENALADIIEKNSGALNALAEEYGKIML